MAESTSTNVDPVKPEDSRRRVMILMGIGVGLLVAALVLPKVLFGGDDDASTDNALIPPTPSSSPGVVVAPGDSTAGPSTTIELGELPESYEVFATRNPFTPLVAPATQDGGAQEGAGEAEGTGEGTNPPSPDNGTEPRMQQQVALLDVAGTSDSSATATVTVDGVVYQVGVNEIFATNYKVVSIDLADGCAGFLLGDDAFSLCRGEEIKK